MRRTNRLAVLCTAVLALSFPVFGCIGHGAAGARLPGWLSRNLAFVKTNIEGTVLIDAKPAGPGMHKGGVGTVLDERHALLPAHVVQGAQTVVVHPRVFDSGRLGITVGDAVAGTIVAIDAEQDAALFEAASDLGTRIPRIDASRRPAAGEHVWYFGQGNAVRFGNVSAPSANAGPMADAIQVAVSADHGDSGAPLVTDDGCVVGFLYATSVDNARTYFVPIGAALAAVGRR